MEVITNKRQAWQIIRGLPFGKHSLQVDKHGEAAVRALAYEYTLRYMQTPEYKAIEQKPEGRIRPIAAITSETAGAIDIVINKHTWVEYSRSEIKQSLQNLKPGQKYIFEGRSETVAYIRNIAAGKGFTVNKTENGCIVALAEEKTVSVYQRIKIAIDALEAVGTVEFKTPVLCNSKTVRYIRNVVSNEAAKRQIKVKCSYNPAKGLLTFTRIQKPDTLDAALADLILVHGQNEAKVRAAIENGLQKYFPNIKTLL